MSLSLETNELTEPELITKLIEDRKNLRELSTKGNQFNIEDNNKIREKWDNRGLNL